MRKLAKQADFKVDNQGSIFLLHPLNDVAREWANEHQDNGYQPYWPSVLVEHRYIGEIVAGIQNDGLVVA